MATCEPFQAGLWDDPSSSSPGDSLASLSAWPGSDAARLTTATSGRKWHALLARSGPVGCLLRTLLGSSRWHSTIVCLAWNASATKRGRLLFRLVPSVPGTGETASGLWRTPAAYEAQQRKGQLLNRLLYPTPTEHGNHNRAGASAKSRDGLATFVKGLIPTPRTEGHDAVRHRGKADSLHSWAKDTTRNGLLTTPTADDTGARTEPYRQGGTALSAQIGGKLNADFVEFLMGYPPGWTKVE